MKIVYNFQKVFSVIYGIFMETLEHKALGLLLRASSREMSSQGSF